MRPLRYIVLGVTLTACAAAGAQINTRAETQQGQQALYAGNYPVAVEHFTQAIAGKPYLAEPYSLRALARYNMRDLEGAKADAATATTLNPFLPGAWEVMGGAAQDLGLLDEAVAAYNRALQLLPYNSQIMLNKARAQRDAGRLDSADTTFVELLTVYPSHDEGFIERSVLRVMQADTVRALADLDAALEVNPYSTRALVMRAELTRTSDLRAAMSDLDAAIITAPDMAEPRVRRARLRLSRGDRRGALADLNRALELEPDNAEAAALSRQLQSLRQPGR